jgi:hypothetical protein
LYYFHRGSEKEFQDFRQVSQILEDKFKIVIVDLEDPESKAKESLIAAAMKNDPKRSPDKFEKSFDESMFALSNKHSDFKMFNMQSFQQEGQRSNGTFIMKFIADLKVLQNQQDLLRYSPFETDVKHVVSYIPADGS